MKHGKHLNGREITQEEMDRYEIELKNHNAMQDYKQSFAKDIFMLVETHGLEKAKERVEEAIRQARSMDAPNPPGYYRANND